MVTRGRRGACTCGRDGFLCPSCERRIERAEVAAAEDARDFEDQWQVAQEQYEQEVLEQWGPQT